MKLKDIKADMKLIAVGSYADCIRSGDRFTVFEDGAGGLVINCRGGIHSLDEAMVHDGDDIPELEPAQ